MRKRNRMELVLEMLETISREGEVNPTKLSLEVNLSYDRVKKIITELAKKGIIEIQIVDDHRGSASITLTPEGMKLLEELRKLKSLLKDYGLP